MTILFFMCAFCHLLHGNFFFHSLILIYLSSPLARSLLCSAFIYSIDVERARVILLQYFKFFVHFLDPRGLNLANVFREMRGFSQSLMNSERERQVAGGRSLISLVVVDTATPSEADSNFAAEQFWMMQETVPDLRWIYWAAGSPNRFDRFVRDPARDLYPLRIDLTGIGGDSIQTVAHPVIHRIQQEPRRIINHRYVSHAYTTL